jgi:aspartyl-tRNA(Asn)/glutamyl-tRNA(Gln) amidotransferase subunit A
MEDMTARALREKIAGGKIKSADVVEQVLKRIGELDVRIGAYISVLGDYAMSRARQVDAKVARGEPVGALAGVPIAVKDNMCMREGTTTCASRILEGFRSPYDACVVERLAAADAVIVGKTNLDEFAMGSSTENSGLKQTLNPWDVSRVPGGSSGGSAAAVAAGMCAGALGSDTGGSVRQPAGFCGVVGLKPTYGRVSRYGLVAYGSSLDQIGPFGRDVGDAALLLGVIAGEDERDSTSVSNDVAEVDNYLDGIEEDIKGLRIGVVSKLNSGADAAVQKAVADALEVYGSAGAEVVEIEMPHFEYAIATYYVIATAEASSNLARYDGVHYGHRSGAADDYVEVYSKSREEGFGDEVKRRIMLGTYALSSGYYDAYYLRALKVRNLIRGDFTKAFDKADCIMMPVSPTTAFRIGEKTDDPLQMYLEDMYTIAANLSGVPGISIPCGFDGEGLPIGLQIMTAAFEEKKLLRIARMFEKRTDWNRHRPEI